MGLKRRIDPPRTFKPEEAQQWYKLQEAIEAELGGAGLANTLFVDGVTGDDPSAVRGSLVFKYETIQGALDAALAGDTIWVTPGTYAEDLTWPATDNITLKGTSKTSTVLVNATAVNTIQMVPTAYIAFATIVDIALTNSGPDLALNVNGAADADMLNGTLRMSDVLMPLGDMAMQTVNDYDFRDIEANEISLAVTDCGDGTLNSSTFDNITVNYNVAPAVPPTSGNGIMTAMSVVVGETLTVNNLGKVAFSKDTAIRTIEGAIVDSATDFGYIQALGTISGNINVTFDLQNADRDVITCDFAKIGSSTVDVADAGTPSTSRGGANFRNALFLDENGTFTAGAECDMDLRGAVFNQASLAVAGDGAIDRSVWIQTIAAGNSAAPVLWENGGGPVPYVSAPDSVTVESATIGELPISVTAKIAASVTCVKTAGDASDHIVTAFKDYVA